ncbi:glycosyltransferase family 4 protein [Aeromicrobium sp. CF3.5]|uniref:glycosyltransferase family 4 protein n=1 Tax=Aeromicrobium sp. CF3.5 TaxID=3373078 RepID=UPI003EE775EA
MTVVLKTNEGGLWVLPQVAEFVRRGAVVTLVIPAGDGKLRRAADAAGYTVAESSFDFSFRPSFGLVRGLLRFRRLLRETEPDVIFYHLYASALSCRISSVGLGARKVHMVAGPLYLENPAIKVFERLMWRFDDHLIAGSDFTARAYQRLGVPDGRMSTIPYGVDLNRYHPGLDERVDLWGAKRATFVVIMVAYVYAPKSSVFPGVGIKGHDILLDAWDEFISQFPESLLVIVGSGFDEAGERHRQQLMQTHAMIGDAVHWADSVSDVRPLYSSADVSVSPSLSENHGAALEASAMGLPSIVSTAGGLPEAVTSQSGWVTAAGQSDPLLAALIQARSKFDDGSLETMGMNARTFMEVEFGIDASTERIAEIVLAD